MSSFGAGSIIDWYSAEEYSMFKKTLLQRKAVGKSVRKNDLGTFFWVKFYDIFSLSVQVEGYVDGQREFTRSTAVLENLRPLCRDQVMVQMVVAAIN
ncbi:hypothetical protein [Rhodococcus sp. 14-2483-1-1]|uniref:hypothetical protein n=1 Tax=Rhodococcus sp. 14-2483-1-1 TaxID=2023148 RepID=UPI0011406CCD|nr:hypothetical protein [Rhodococcus sp. 14-2483-1-1]